MKSWLNDNIAAGAFKLRNFGDSLKIAFEGIRYLFLYHQNMRLIFLLGIAAFLLGIFFKLKGIELVTLCITVTMVFMAEIFNTAVELIIDMFTDQYHFMIKIVKDIAAAVVVLASLNALAVGYILFVRKIIK